MCYPVAYWQGAYYSASPRRQFVVPLAAARELAARQRERVNTDGGLAGGGGVGVTKLCLCSPTTHPGSFRCRQHHGEYQWVCRLFHNSTPARLEKKIMDNQCNSMKHGPLSSRLLSKSKETQFGS